MMQRSVRPAPTRPGGLGAPKKPGSPPVAKRFEGELEVPKFKTADYRNLNKEEAMAQAKEIKNFLDSLKKATDPVNKILKDIAQTEEKISNVKQDLREEQKAFSAAQGNLEVLSGSKPEETVFLMLSAGKTPDRIPYYPDKQFDEINKNRPADKKLPEALRKTKAEVGFESMVSTLSKTVKEKEQAVTELEAKLVELKNSSNNGIAFGEFQKLITTKEGLVNLWGAALKSRENIVAGKVSVIKAPIQAAQKAVSEDLLSGDEDIESLSQQAQILLKTADKDPASFYKKQKPEG